jgi:hypothetical protein
MLMLAGMVDSLSWILDVCAEGVVERELRRYVFRRKPSGGVGKRTLPNMLVSECTQEHIRGVQAEQNGAAQSEREGRDVPGPGLYQAGWRRCGQVSWSLMVRSTRQGLSKPEAGVGSSKVGYGVGGGGQGQGVGKRQTGYAGGWTEGKNVGGGERW